MVINYQKARQALIENELRPRGIYDQRLIKAFEKIPRHRLVSRRYWKEAYFDYPLPIGQNQFTSQPSLIALMIQTLDLNKNDKVLEIGTGCGYMTALLAVIVKKVYTVEIERTLLTRAVKKFDQLGLTNIYSKVDDGNLGWREYAPFEAVVVSAAVPKIPESLITQLKNDGKIIIPIGEDQSNQILTLGIKKCDRLVLKQLQEVRFVPMVGE